MTPAEGKADGRSGSSGSEWSVILSLAVVAALAPLAIDMYLPSFPTLQREFGVSATQIQLTLSGYMVGFTAGQIGYGPLSDRFGRKPVLLSGVLLFIAATVLCALSTDISSLILFRFLQAVGGGAGTVLSRAIVRDLYEGAAMARIMSIMLIAVLFAPMVAPFAGGYILIWVGWRAVFWVLAAVGLAALLITVFRIPETLPEERRGSPGVLSLLRGYGAVLAHRRALGYILSGGVTFGALFAFLSGAPFVFIEYYGLEPQEMGYVFMINVVGVMAGGWLNARYVESAGVYRMMVASTLLLLAGTAAAFGLIAFDVFGVWGAIAGIMIFTLPINMINANAAAGALEYFPHLAGTASAAVGAVRYGCGAAAGLCVGLLHDGTPLPMAAVMLGCAVISTVFLAAMVRR